MAGPVWAARVPWRPERCCANHQARIALMPSRAEPATCLVDQLPSRAVWVQLASRSGAPRAKTSLRFRTPNTGPACPMSTCFGPGANDWEAQVGTATLNPERLSVANAQHASPVSRATWATSRAPVMELR